MGPPSSTIGDVADKVLSMAQNLTNETFPPSTSILPPAKWKVLSAGAAAGLVVDSSLYPIDTIKSRLQSKSGFVKSGGFKHLYRGLPPVLVGSVPNAAIFFLTYESIKNKLHQYKQFGTFGKHHVLSHIIAASIGEVASCTVRVPYEVIKMRSQTMVSKEVVSNMAILRDCIAKEGVAGLYRGFSSTVIRDLPFSALQYPIWERLKLNHLKKHKKPVSASESAYYGSIAGAIAAFLTTPLDVAKTRIMLAEKSDALASGKISHALAQIYAEKGLIGLFAGVVPRCLWISVGAAIFLGSYEKAIKMLNS